jgi:hypothetical protein
MNLIDDVRRERKLRRLQFELEQVCKQQKAPNDDIRDVLISMLVKAESSDAIAETNLKLEKADGNDE